MKKQLAIMSVMALLITVGLNGCTELTKNNHTNEINIPVIKSFYATPNNINEGEIVTLSWNINNATNVYIDNDIGVVKQHGNLIFTPTKTTTYKITATNAFSNISESIQINVTNDLGVESENFTIGSSSGYMYGEWFYEDIIASCPPNTDCSYSTTINGSYPDNFDSDIYEEYADEGIGHLNKHYIDDEYDFFICKWDVKKAKNGVIIGDIDPTSIDPFSNTKIYFRVMNPTGQHDFFYNINENIRNIKLRITEENIGQWDFDFWYEGINYDAIVTYEIYLIKTIDSDKVDFNKFVGTWLGEDGITRTYYSNGTAENSIEGYAGTWKIENSKHIFTNTNDDISTWTYTFYANYTRLTLTSEYGISTEMTKQ